MLKILSLSFYPVNMSETLSLASLPTSPNYVSTLAEKKSRYMKPLKFSEDIFHASKKLEFIIATYPQAELVEKRPGFLHYAFTTTIGKFIDDVIFVIEENTQEIHFSSTSRKGYGDFGKNRRRMKMIQKDWIFFD